MPQMSQTLQVDLSVARDDAHPERFDISGDTLQALDITGLVGVAMKYKGVDRLKSGDFNTMNVECQPDGSRRITLSKDGEKKVYRFRVENLYQADEKVLEHKVISIDTPEYIKERMTEVNRLP
jgi:hypothetical protein